MNVQFNSDIQVNAFSHVCVLSQEADAIATDEEILAAGHLGTLATSQFKM